MMSISRISKKCGCANTTMQQNGSRFVPYGGPGNKLPACTCDIIPSWRSLPLVVFRKQKHAYVRCVQSVLAVPAIFIVPNNVPIVGHTCVRIGTYAYCAYVRSAVHIDQPAALPIAVRTAVPIAVPVAVPNAVRIVVPIAVHIATPIAVPIAVPTYCCAP